MVVGGSDKVANCAVGENRGLEGNERGGGGGDGE